MSNEVVVHIHNGILFINKKMKLTGKWNNLENVISGEVLSLKKTVSHSVSHVPSLTHGV